jgi:hypothetical protein
MDATGAIGSWAGWVIQWIIHPVTLVGTPLVCLGIAISKVVEAYNECDALRVDRVHRVQRKQWEQEQRARQLRAERDRSVRAESEAKYKLEREKRLRTDLEAKLLAEREGRIQAERRREMQTEYRSAASVPESTSAADFSQRAAESPDVPDEGPVARQVAINVQQMPTPDPVQIPEDLGTRTLAAALLPFVALIFVYVFQSAVFSEVADYGGLFGFVCAFGVGFLILFHSRLDKHFALPISAFCFSAVFSALVFSYAAVRDVRLFALYYGFALGALSHVALLGLPKRQHAIVDSTDILLPPETQLQK